MLIPVRCFTCGKVLADKWRAYEARTAAPADAAADKAAVMTELGITKVCCRRHMLTTVDLMDVI